MNSTSGESNDFATFFYVNETCSAWIKNFVSFFFDIINLNGVPLLFGCHGVSLLEFY